MDKDSEYTINLWKSVVKDFPEPNMKQWLEEDIQHFIDAWEYINHSDPNSVLPWTSVYQSEACPVKLPDDPEMRDKLWEI